MMPGIKMIFLFEAASQRNHIGLLAHLSGAGPIFFAGAFDDAQPVGWRSGCAHCARRIQWADRPPHRLGQRAVPFRTHTVWFSIMFPTSWGKWWWFRCCHFSPKTGFWCPKVLRWPGAAGSFWKLFHDAVEHFLTRTEAATSNEFGKTCWRYVFLELKNGHGEKNMGTPKNGCQRPIKKKKTNVASQQPFVGSLGQVTDGAVK